MGFPSFVVKKYISHKGDKKFISLISLITIIGIALGVSIMIITLSILDGFESTITRKVINFNSHIKITSFGNRDLERDNSTMEQVKKDLDGHMVSMNPYLSKLAIIRSETHSEGITLLGVNAGREETEIGSFITKGSLKNLADSSMAGIALGSKLADKLFITVGDTITIFSLKNDRIPSPTNPPAILQFKVSAIYQSGMKEYDDIYGYVDINMMRKLLGLGDVVSGYNIKINNIALADSLSNYLQNDLRYPYYVRSVFTLHRNIFTWIDLQKQPIPLVLGLIVIVAVFNIVGTLLINVLEKTREIGIMKSLGAKRRQILSVFVYQGLFLGGVGIIIGNILALLLSYVQNNYHIVSIPQSVYYLSTIPIEINLFNYVLISFLALVLSLLASLIPSFVASKVKPVSAMRFD